VLCGVEARRLSERLSSISALGKHIRSHDLCSQAFYILGGNKHPPPHPPSAELLFRDQVVDCSNREGKGAGGLFTAIEELLEGDDIHRLLHFSSFRPLATISRIPLTVLYAMSHSADVTDQVSLRSPGSGLIG
jgi:hypothetical protein